MPLHVQSIWLQNFLWQAKSFPGSLLEQSPHFGLRAWCRTTNPVFSGLLSKEKRCRGSVLAGLLKRNEAVFPACGPTSKRSCQVLVARVPALAVGILAKCQAYLVAVHTGAHGQSGCSQISAVFVGGIFAPRIIKLIWLKHEHGLLVCGNHDILSKYLAKQRLKPVSKIFKAKTHTKFFFYSTHIFPDISCPKLS